MRVGGFNNSNKILNLYNSNNKNIENKESKDKRKMKDSLEISSLGKNLAAYHTNEENINSSEKIAKIKEEIEKGTYNRDSKLIADSILEEIKKSNNK